MSSRDLEKEYDATQWSQRITDPVELLQSHDEYSNTGDLFADNLHKKLEKFLLFSSNFFSFGCKSVRSELLA